MSDTAVVATAPTTAAPAVPDGGAPAAAPAAAAKPKASLMEKLRALQSGKPLEEAAAPVAESAQEPAASNSEAPAEEAQAGEAQETPPAEEPKEPATPVEAAKAQLYEHRIAQAMLKAQKAEREALTHKKTADSAAARLKELESTLEALKSDPVKALAHAGTDPTALAQMMLDGKLQASNLPPKLELPPEVQELVEQGKQAKARAEQEAREAEAAAVREENLKLVEQAVNASVADFPALEALSPSLVLNTYEAMTRKNKGVEPSFAEVAKHLQETVVSDLNHFLSNDGVLKAFGGQLSPEVKSKIAKALGLDQAERTVSPTREGNQPAAKPAAAQSNAQASGTEQTTAAPATVTNRNVTSVPGRDAKAKSSSADLAAKINREILKRA